MEVHIDRYGFKTIQTGYTLDIERSDIDNIYQSMVIGVRNYFKDSNAQEAILGLSGGIDSALVAAIAVEALGASNVVGVLLPSQYSSDHSIDDAVALANNLGIRYSVVPIETTFKTILTDLEPLFNGTATGVAEENLQARIRGTILMTIANKFGYILLNTSNKSESAVGYGTIYGDMCGGISVIGNVYKTTVYQLSNYINRDKEIIPQNTIMKAPSAELRPDQKDSDSLPDYDVLDRILIEYIENDKTEVEIVAMGFDKDTVNKCQRLIAISEWKRIQAPPALQCEVPVYNS